MDGPNATYARYSLAEFSERLASAEPVPGGGSASAYVGSLAASLVCMVARLSLGRPKYDQFTATNERALAAGESARLRLLELADEDARAYGAYSAARAMPRETDAEQRAREQASRAAAREASEVPLTVARECASLLDIIDSMAGRSNLNAASDLEVAARLSSAALRGAAANVLVNLPQVGDERYLGVTTAEVGGLVKDSDRALAQIAQRVAHGQLREAEREPERERA